MLGQEIFVLEEATMKVTRGLSRLEKIEPCGLAIGNFDGVHRGHQTILHSARSETTRLGLPLVVLTFDRHPKALIDPSQAPLQILPLRDKLLALKKCGVDHVIIQPFTKAFAAKTADKFINEVLVAQLNIRWLQVSPDFRFGFRRQGNFEHLADAAKANSFYVHRSHLVVDQGRRISSSWIREALAKGNLSEAARLLGRSYSISARALEPTDERFYRSWVSVGVRLQRPAISGTFLVHLQAEGGASERTIARLTSNTAQKVLHNVEVLRTAGVSLLARERVTLHFLRPFCSSLESRTSFEVEWHN
jgi:riboflavin kinase / FMN adenylyltransferase